jgi:hypothetical protein
MPARLFDNSPVESFGTIAIRVVVLPKKDRGDSSQSSERDQPLDLEPDEPVSEGGSTPLASYLESSKGGKQCCVFLVNGQRQDSLDNSFIMQQLGFKYLRNRMMIVVDVDGLNPESLGHLMQGSRQGFYRGEVWDAIVRRIVATLKDDPDLIRLEEEAEEQVSELEAGDEKVKQTLDQLIEAHHEHGVSYAEGLGTGGERQGEVLNLNTVNKDGVVSLLPPDKGVPADYPVLVSQPSATSVRVRPREVKSVVVRAMPSSAWPALAEIVVEPDGGVPDLLIEQEKHESEFQLRLTFRQPKDFDEDQYPLRATLNVNARFNGIKEPRQLTLNVLVKPENPPEPVELFDPPTWLKVSSRQPIRIKKGGADAHVRLRWDGRDDLAAGPSATWTFSVAEITRPDLQPQANFSQPNEGRISLLVTPRDEWSIGDQLSFQVKASGPNNSQLTADFVAEVVQPATVEEAKDEPRRVESQLGIGASRRPPYSLKYINRDDYESVECWSGSNWTDEDSGCFTEPTERAPLTLIINKDMGALQEYRRYLTKNYVETEVERRINKYTSHVAFHLYQMYQATLEPTEVAIEPQHQRAEIQRVAMTLIKLMEVSR